MLGGLASGLAEVENQWSLGDVLEGNDLLDMKDDLERQEMERVAKQRRR